MMAIQAVEAEVTRLTADRELQLFHLAYVKAAWELEAAYKLALQNSSNLPPYAQLVKR